MKASFNQKTLSMAIIFAIMAISLFLNCAIGGVARKYKREAEMNSHDAEYWKTIAQNSYACCTNEIYAANKVAVNIFHETKCKRLFWVQTQNQDGTFAWSVITEFIFKNKSLPIIRYMALTNPPQIFTLTFSPDDNDIYRNGVVDK